MQLGPFYVEQLEFSDHYIFQSKVRSQPPSNPKSIEKEETIGNFSSDADVVCQFSTSIFM